jgi:hypothetical protein
MKIEGKASGGWVVDMGHVWWHIVVGVVGVMGVVGVRQQNMTEMQRQEEL